MAQTVLITGASRRIGKGFAEYFSARGWNIVIHYNHSSDAALELSNHLKASYPTQKFPIIQCDLSNSIESVQRLIYKLPDGIDRLDALINNASIFKSGDLHSSTSKIWDLHFRINLETPFYLMQGFRASFGKGCIINILDTKVDSFDTFHAAYLLSKKSLRDLTMMAAFEWAPDIRVNAVAPGAVLPPPGKDEDYLQHIANQSPLKRVVKLENLSESVYFLVSNSSITGQVIYCDSGAHLNF